MMPLSLNLRRGCTLYAGASGAVGCMDVSCEKLQGVSSCEALTGLK